MKALPSWRSFEWVSPGLENRGNCMLSRVSTSYANTDGVLVGLVTLRHIQTSQHSRTGHWPIAAPWWCTNKWRRDRFQRMCSSLSMCFIIWITSWDPQEHGTTNLVTWLPERLHHSGHRTKRFRFPLPHMSRHQSWASTHIGIKTSCATLHTDRVIE